MSEIRIGSFVDKKVTFLEDLSEATFNEFMKHKQVLVDSQHHLALIDMVKENYVDFINHLNAYTDKFSEVKFDRSDAHIYFNANRFLLNFLSSTKTFLDHTDSDVVKYFGKDSSERTTYEKLKSDQFDHSFAYRFCYRLRNYAQHCGLPINKMSVHITTNETDPTQYRGELNVAFVRDELLNRFEKWGPVKKDLLEQPEEFEVVPLIAEYGNILAALSKWLIDLRQNTIRDSAEYIQKMGSNVKVDLKSLKVFKDIIETENGLNFTVEDIPFDLVDEVLRR